jgi:geranylgeranyl diphosphate synthase type II
MDQLNRYSEPLEHAIAHLSLPVEPANLYDPLRYFMTLGGKRIRPVLTLLGTELFNKSFETSIPSALAVELFHNFTLIHDDIMDKAPLRRGMETVHTKWDENIAILSGDVLFVKAYQLLEQQEEHHLGPLMKLFNRTAIEVCEGQQMDMDFENRTDVSIDEYLKMIRLKTSVLLGCALEMGAIVAGTDADNRSKIYAFGEHLGMAFQIQDDILDLYADPEKFGKQVGGDVLADKKTLLSLNAHKLANAVQKEQLTVLQKEGDQQRKIAIAQELFITIGAKDACIEVMNLHHNKALEALMSINGNEDIKRQLHAVAEYLLVRTV